MPADSDVPVDASWLATKYGARDEGDISLIMPDNSGNITVLVLRSRDVTRDAVVKVHTSDKLESQHWAWAVNGRRVPTPKNMEQARQLLRLIGVEPVPASSSNIKWFYHDLTDLRVEFKNNTLYRYVKVPFDLYYEMCEAESVGSFLAKHIKGKYSHVQLPITAPVAADQATGND